ncbi:MAG: polysaccharide biosynthesis protein, partial [Rhodobacterales bacterium]|nr:polysaccharide biosynthesis protein [Rhodobacterales bacterium]MDX5501155.1 polysaccharide biosynthesis protein [Rhodobacterales bacterium]
GMTGIVLSMLAFMALAGVPLVHLLYDPRYAVAGAVVVALACAQMPQLIVATYDQAALAAGDSRGFFRVVLLRAGAQLALFLTGAEIAGLPGALVGQALAGLVAAPASMWLARRHGVHDARHDVIYVLLSALIAALALWFSSNSLAALLDL